MTRGLAAPLRHQYNRFPQPNRTVQINAKYCGDIAVHNFCDLDSFNFIDFVFMDHVHAIFS